MKIQCANFPRPGQRGRGTPQLRESGSAVFVFIALLAIMMILIMASATPLVQLRIEEKLIEQKQIERLNVSQTNAVAATVSPAKPELK